MSTSEEHLGTHDAVDRKQGVFSRAAPLVKKIDRGLLALAHARWLRGLVMFSLASILTAMALSAVPIAYGSIAQVSTIQAALPDGSMVMGAFGHSLTVALDDFSSALHGIGIMWHDWFLPALLISGFLLHAILVYREIRRWSDEASDRQVQKHPFFWRAMAGVGAILMAVPILTVFAGATA